MLNINNLIVEVTRKCNMKCEHCLRGNAQRLDMSDEVIAAMFKGVRHVGDVTFTGGEPTMAVPVIEKVIEAARAARVSIGNFFVVTNGKTNAKTARRFALCLLDLYSTLDEAEEGITALTVSGDMFHEEVTIPNVYKGLAFFSKERHGPRDDRDVIRTGRAAVSGFGEREPRAFQPFEVEEYDDDVNVDRVYVAANGNVVSDCDRSYKDIDTEARGNVLRGTLGDIVILDKVESEVAA